VSGSVVKIVTSLFTRNKASVTASSRDVMLSDASTFSVYQSNYTDNLKNSFNAVFYCQKGYILTSNQTTCQACVAGSYSSLGYENSTLEGVRSLRSLLQYIVLQTCCALLLICILQPTTP
jgi:hypothetical protein